MTLTTYAAPIRMLPIDQIQTDDILAVLKPIWFTKAETASRLRGRLETVLNAAKAQGLRSGDNPAAWKGHLKNLLPTRSKLARGHHAAMAIDDMPNFIAQLKAVDGASARALEFTILTSARSGETLGARWEEFDQERRSWVIPALRMKAGVEHRVPLSDAAMTVIGKMQQLKTGEFVFVGANRKAPLSDMALAMVLRRLHAGVTVHGFRSTFRDWASERTAFPPDVCEMALAHTVRDKTEAAYRRGDLFDKRRMLMEAWALFIGSPIAQKVVRIVAKSVGPTDRS